ncbi:MAG: membrane integrity-associated transporter subunit PqiC [Desulfobacterales bacterium]|nr:MAG: membrane integrity-associated transporter subunit PqiC [Desulfobacterales bacterium]
MRNNYTNSFILHNKWVLLGVVLVMLMGCGTTEPSRYYTLSSLTSSGDEMQVFRDAYRLSIEVGPVHLPKYLQRPQIITRLSPNKIETADFDRWAEPLEDNVLRVLVENLAHLLWDDHIAVFPWIGSTGVNYRISVNITRFDGQLGGDIFLMAGWAIYDRETNNILLERRSVLKEASGQTGYSAMVSAKSRALADLSREIANGIRSMD